METSAEITKRLLARLDALQPEHREQGGMTLFSRMLRSMSEEEIAACRMRILETMDDQPELIELIDGHLAFRELSRTDASEPDLNQEILFSKTPCPSHLAIPPEKCGNHPS